MATRITIQIVGDKTDRQDVRLDDFIRQLNDVKKALRENEISVTGKEETTLDYKVVDLRHSSPATVVLEPIAATPDVAIDRMFAKKVVGAFATELRTIKRKGELTREPELDRLLAYQRIGIRENSRVSKVKIAVGSNAVTIDEKFRQKLNAIVGPDEFAEGSISGTIEVVNIHNKNQFYLYPVIGPKRVTGTFREYLRPKIKNAIGEYVTVQGKLRYKAWSQYPHGIVAEELTIHEPDSALPTLTEMRGAFAGSMGNLNSVEFVEQLRDETQ